VKIQGVNLTYQGLVPKVQKSMLSKDPDALQPHIHAEKTPSKAHV
jgi:hypothetical protein